MENLDGSAQWDTLAKRIRGCRLARSLTQEQLSEASGVKQGDISKLEGGISLSSTRTPELAQALRVDAYWLNTGKGAPEPSAAPSLFTDQPWTEYQPVRPGKFHFVPVLGQGVGGTMPERIWTDGDFPVGATNEYAEVMSVDPHAFIIKIVGFSMAPKYSPPDYALVEPSTEPDLEDDVLVRLKDGQTLIKKLLSRRGSHIKLGSYNDPQVLVYEKDEVTWMYYVAYPVPARKIKNRV